MARYVDSRLILAMQVVYGSHTFTVVVVTLRLLTVLLICYVQQRL